eukprot:TRINITY_DN5592_c0_g1_i6.p1 TRINITY_DN5592_c0_g1~~TRINITY_DN5592_c0_g1_i6.p1  ORF type:complete len:220 (+),score=23.85 TRINITY_DN5592_c0_g1_i6:412-1071(+)
MLGVQLWLMYLDLGFTLSSSLTQEEQKSLRRHLQVKLQDFEKRKKLALIEQNINDDDRLPSERGTPSHGDIPEVDMRQLMAPSPTLTSFLSSDVSVNDQMKEFIKSRIGDQPDSLRMIDRFVSADVLHRDRSFSRACLVRYFKTSNELWILDRNTHENLMHGYPTKVDIISDDMTTVELKFRGVKNRRLIMRLLAENAYEHWIREVIESLPKKLNAQTQ